MCETLALFNVTKHSRGAVLVTFDKRLLQAVRLVQNWKEPWAEYLKVENCQTFWVWYLTDPKIAKHPAAETLKEVMDDFRLKSRQLFRPTHSVGDGIQPIWLTNKSSLEALCRRYEVLPQNVASKENSYKAEVIEQLRKTLDERKKSEEGASSDSIEIIQKACRSFFKEVEEILPSFQLIISDGFDREKTLELMLQKYGMQKQDFFNALNEEIQGHAKYSLHILGASSLVSPKTIRAVYAFSAFNQGRPASRRFVHRVPLPIQSTEFDLDEVVALVSNDQAKLEARYDRLTKIASLKGAIADLTVAYLLANSGSWQDAEEICRGQLSRTHSDIDAIYYEIHLLLAAILRIFKTNSRKLLEAEQLLHMARESTAPRPSSDRSDIRIRLELIAIRLNRRLLDRYRSSHSSEVQREEELQDAQEIIQALLRLKCEVADLPDVPEMLREKINANINVNCCLVLHFVMPSKNIPVFGDDVYGQLLTESFLRMTRQTARISFFEEIIISFCALSSPTLIRNANFKELEVAGALSSRLSRVLQRDEPINDFELWIYNYIREKLDGLGY